MNRISSISGLTPNRFLQQVRSNKLREFPHFYFSTVYYIFHQPQVQNDKLTKPNEEPKRFGLENQVKRNPHPDFNKVENSRPPFDFENTWTYTQIPNKDWKVGSGANDPSWKDHKKLEIDPYGEGRNPVDNYKTLISAIVPRPIGFVSTVSKTGERNLAPFSYFTMVNHDPPILHWDFPVERNPKGHMQ